VPTKIVPLPQLTGAGEGPKRPVTARV
jgi:hypothetical protein